MATLGTRIKMARENIGMSQGELATAIGIKPSSGVISNWERDLNKPDAEKIVKLCEVLNISASFLLDYYGKSTIEFSPLEINHIEKYRSLDDTGKERIDYELNKELIRVEELQNQQKQIADQQDQINQLKRRIVTEVIHRIVLPLYAGFASAGSGEYLFDDIPTDTIEVEDTPTARKADFVIGVNGASMEPDYYDGEKVFVKKTIDLSVGDVGIFLKGSDCYIKELGEDRLISRNKDYKDIYADEEIRRIGKVLGKVNED